MSFTIDDLLKANNLPENRVNVEKPKIITYENVFEVTDYLDVCKYLNEKPFVLEDFKKFGKLSNKILNVSKIDQIQRFYNGEWVLEWNNVEQKKWYPCFNLNASFGLVGFHYSCYYFSHFHGLSSFYKDKKISDFVGKTYWNIYKELL